jgi:dnd system-associated protein 4
MDDRIRYDRPEIYDRLVNEHGVFNSYLDLFMFAAAFGFHNDHKRPNEGGDKEMLWMHVENTDLYESVAAAIAYQETSNPEVLSKPGEQLEILGQYAAGGIALLEDEFEGGGDPTIDVAEFVLDTGTSPDAETDSELEDLL